MPLCIFCQKISQAGFERWGPKQHSCLLRGFVSFIDIASMACGHEIDPVGLSSFGPGDHMVKGELLFGSAILAFLTVPSEDIGPVEQNSPVRNVFVFIQSDDGRILKTFGHGPDGQIFIKNQATYFFQIAQDEGLLDRHHSDRGMIQV